jgi:uncharacterized protein
MRQSWHDLLFAHWPIDSQMLRPLVPSVLTLDTHERTAWLGIVPFHMSNVTLRGVPPLPGLSAFPELNVRTYVTSGDRRGVYFFSLDAANALAVGAARLLVGLPYFRAEMRVERAEGAIHYRSRRRGAGSGAEFVARYHPIGDPFTPAVGSLEHWLTERYCLYTVRRRNRVRRLDIDHEPWRLQPAAAEVSLNTMTAPLGLRLPSIAPLLHFALRQDMVGWAPLKVTP